MGCSAKAISDDVDDLEIAMRKTGLNNHRDWKSIQLYSVEDDAVQEAAHRGLYMEEAIAHIKQRQKERDERVQAQQEREERALLAKLQAKYATKSDPEGAFKVWGGDSHQWESFHAGYLAGAK